MTSYPDIFTLLALPFEAWEVKTLPKGGGMLYVSARSVMNRLDDVLGPENWWDEYTPGQNSVMCRLTIKLPDGTVITKADAGGYAGMADSGDDDKSGFSDAIKRAAVKFGVARYLCKDGVPAFAREAFAEEEARIAAGGKKPIPTPARKAPPQPEPPAPVAAEPPKAWLPNTPRALFDWMQSQTDQNGIDVTSHIKTFSRGKNFPDKIAKWSEAQLLLAHAEAIRFIKDALAPSDMANA